MNPRLHLAAFFVLAFLGVGHPVAAQHTASSPVTASAVMTFPSGTPLEDVIDTGNKAINNLMANFSESRNAPGAKGFILLPLPRDLQNNYFNQQFETALSQHFADKGLKVYTRNDDTLAQIFDFAAWAQNFPDAIDNNTVQRLGGIVDAPAVISPRLDITVDDRGTITARANMRVILRASTKIEPGVNEGYAQMRSMPTNAELIRWGGYGLGGLVLLICVAKFLAAVKRALRPR